MNIQHMTDLVAGIPNGEYAVHIQGTAPNGARMDLYYFVGRGDSYGYAVTQANDLTVISYELTRSIPETVDEALQLTRLLTVGVPSYDLAINKGNHFDAAFPNGITGIAHKENT